MSHRRARAVRVLRVRYRRLLRRLDRRTPEWMQWLTPWGTSLALHSAVLLVFGVFLFIQSRGPARGAHEFAAQLTDDLTSLGRSDHAGDPFSRLQTSEPPSLYLNPAMADAAATNVPELPPDMRLGVELKLRPPGLAGAGKGPGGKGRAGAAKSAQKKGTRGAGGGAGQEAAEEEMAALRTAPFTGRQGEKKAKLLRREGGTVESEKAVERGLDWLARHQARDGSWSLDVTPLCRKSPGCPPTPAGVSDSGATGLALLPMLGSGHTHLEKGRYQAAIARGLRWLVKHQHPSGEVFTIGGEHTALYSHAIATMALCESYGMTGDPALREPARKALGYILASQDKFGGGWRYYPGQAGDTSVFGWQLFALRSGKMAGIGIPKGTIRRAREYLDSAAADSSGVYYTYMPGYRVSPSMTAQGLLARQILGWPRDHAVLNRGVAVVAADLQANDQRNTYYWYYATQLLHNMHGPEWPAWNERVRDGLISLQVLGDGCDHGSWDPTSPQPDYWLMRGGRLAITSMSLLTLEVYYRYLPMYREPGDELDDAAPTPAPKAADAPVAAKAR